MSSDYTGDDTRPTWRDETPFCPLCGADLSQDASVSYTERYEGRYTRTAFGEAVEHDGDTICSEAC